MSHPLLKAAAFILFMSVNIAHASTDPGTYIGFDINSALIGEANTDNSSGEDLSGNLGVSAASLSLGYRFESNNRIQISTSKMSLEHENGTDSDVSGYDLDWHIAYGEDAVQPYWGFGFGLYNMDDSSGYFVNDNDLQGNSFQVLAGMKFDLNKYLELDLSYRIKTIAWQEMLFFDGNQVVSVHMTHTYSSLNMGAAVKF